FSAASSLAFRGRFSARRVLPRFASVGVPLTYRVAIANETGRRQEGLVLMEELTDPRPSFEEFVTAHEPGEERRNWFDRQVGYPRWAWLVAQKRGAVITPRPLPPLAPTGETEVTLEFPPLRRIHWKSWARVGRPVVKEYLDEFFVRHALVLDTFTGSLGDPAFEDAVSVAASAAISMETQESLLDLMFVGPEAYCFTAGRGVGHTERLLEVLACVGPCRDKPFRALHHAVIERHDALSGCVCVLLAWDEPRQEFVRHLEALGTPTRVVVVGARGALAALPGDI